MTSDILNYEGIATRYRRMRKASFELNKSLTKYVSKEGLEATGKKLGFWRKGVLVFDNEDQASVLFDHAIYEYFTDGGNAADRYAADHPPPPGSDQEAVLAAGGRAFYSLFRVEQIVPGVGVHVHDLLRQRRHLIADVGFSQTAVKGMVLATRVLPFEDFLMTGGAALPVDADTLTKISRLPAMKIPPQAIEGMSRQQTADLAAAIIRLCLESDSSRQVSYQGIDQTMQGTRTIRAAEPRVGRNDPCPCGSGRKYKKCCGK